MSGIRFKTALPQIHRLFACGITTGLSDRELLRRYCAAGDERAFEDLVARHGPMVLSVCRSVLRDEDDAEDAFQAVFLILVRRAGSILVDESLGGWLHRVAYRVAFRARVQGTQRRARERTGVEVDAIDSRTGTSGDARFEALHEEIARLSQPDRQALVLCLLEGKTQVEAAQEAGCGEATIRRRLAKARDRLRDRLDDRDVGLMTPAILPAVPSALIKATVSATTGPMPALAASVLSGMTRTSVLRAAAVLLAIGLGTACTVGAVLAIQPGITKGPAANQPTVPVAAPNPQPQAQLQPQLQAIPVGQQPEGELDVPGRVVGPDGKPVAGALVFMRAYGDRLPERKATTDPGGRFLFSTRHELGWKSLLIPGEVVTKTAPNVTVTAPGRFVWSAYPDADEIEHLKPRLIAVAPGFGFSLPIKGDDVTIQLAADEPIVGRIVDAIGRPVAGARIRVRNLYWPKPVDGSGQGRLDLWFKAVQRVTYVQEFIQAVDQYLIPLTASLGNILAIHAPIVPPVTSDADGRFRLAGLGRERVAEIVIDGQGLASSLIVAATRPTDKPLSIPAKAPAVKNVLSNTWDDLTVFGNRVDLVVGAGRAVEGVVTDRDSGIPLAGLVVHGPWRSPLEYHDYDRFQSPTDERGRYRIEGLPAPSHGEFTVDPPQDRPYLGRKAQVKIEAGPDPLKFDLPLRRGIWMTGRVLDDATGQPLRDSVIQYYVFADNPHLRKDLKGGSPPELSPQARTDLEGRFRIAGYLGRGIVTAWSGHYLAGVGADKIAGLKNEPISDQLYPPYQFSQGNVDAVVEVNGAEGAESIACELRLKKGKSGEVQVVGQGNQPELGVEASGLAHQIENPMTAIQGDHFQVTNLYPGEAREVVARVVSKRLIGLATVMEAGEGPVTLRLRPWAALTGRLVDDAGKPRTQAMEIRLDNGKLPIHTLNGRGYDHPTFPIDPDGRFRIEGLVAGPTYKLQAFEAGFRILGDVTSGLVFEPGETRDLGDVKVHH